MKDNTIIFVEEFDQSSLLKKTCSYLNPFNQPAEVIKTPTRKSKETWQKLKHEIEEVYLVEKILNNPQTSRGYQESFCLDAGKKRMSLTIHPSRGLFFRFRALERINEILKTKGLSPAELRWSHTTGFFQIFWKKNNPYGPDGGGKHQRRT